MVGVADAKAQTSRSGNTKQIILAALLVGALLVYPWLSPSPYWVTLAVDVFIMAIFALSFNLLLGYVGLLSLGHSLFYGVGAYATGLLLVRAGLGLGWVMPLAFVLALTVALIFGLLSLRVHGIFFALVTLAFAELARLAALKMSRLTGGEDGLTGIPTPLWLSDHTTFYYTALLLLAAVFLLLRRLIASPIGTILLAIRENERRASAIGYNIFAYKLLVITIAGMLATLAGGLHALFFRYVSAMAFSVDTTLNVLLMTIIGGSGTLFGPILGAVIVRAAGAVLSSYTHQWLLIFGLIYIFVVLFMPQGLLGGRPTVPREMVLMWRSLWQRRRSVRR